LRGLGSLQVFDVSALKLLPFTPNHNSSTRAVTPSSAHKLNSIGVAAAA